MGKASNYSVLAFNGVKTFPEGLNRLQIVCRECILKECFSSAPKTGVCHCVMLHRLLSEHRPRGNE